MQPIVNSQSKGSVLHNYAYDTYANQKIMNLSAKKDSWVLRTDLSQDIDVRKQRNAKIRI